MTITVNLIFLVVALVTGSLVYSEIKGWRRERRGIHVFHVETTDKEYIDALTETSKAHKRKSDQ